MEQYAGLGGAVLVREMVKLTKTMWEGKSYSGFLTILCSLIYGIVLNIAIAIYLSSNITVSVGVGIVTGALSSVWNQVIETK